MKPWQIILIILGVAVLMFIVVKWINYGKEDATYISPNEGKAYDLNGNEVPNPFKN